MRGLRRFDDHDEIETFVKIGEGDGIPQGIRIQRLNLLSDFSLVVGWIEGTVDQRPGSSSILGVEVPEFILRVGG